MRRREGGGNVKCAPKRKGEGGRKGEGCGKGDHDNWKNRRKRRKVRSEVDVNWRKEGREVKEEEV